MEYIYAFLCFSSLWRPKYCINLFYWQQIEDWQYACTVPLSVATVRWFRLCKHVPNSWFFVSLLVHPTPGHDDSNSRSWGFVGPFLWLPLSMAEAAPGFAGLCLSKPGRWRARVLAWVGGSAAFFPRSFLAFHRNTATALGFEPAGHRRRCLAVQAAFAPQAAVPYLLQGKGGRPYGGILWSRFRRWAPVGPCWPRSEYRHILLGLCSCLESKWFEVGGQIG